MTSDDAQSVPQRSIARRLAAVGLPAFALGLTLAWANAAGGRRFDFLLLPPILLLLVVAPRWPGGRSAADPLAPDGDRRVEPLLRGSVGVAAAIILGLTLLRQRDPAAVALTVPLLALWVAVAYAALTAALGPRAAQGGALAGLAGLAGLGLAFRLDAPQALGAALLTPTPWMTLALVALPVLALARPWRRRFHWPLYALAVGALAAYWRWGVPLAGIAGIGRLAPFEGRALGLIPAFILIGGGAQLLLAILLPRVPWGRTAAADLAATLPLAGVPILAALLPLRTRLPFEDDFGVAWLALVLVAIVLLRAAVAVAFARRAAGAVDLAATPRARDTRLALACFVLCVAAYWPAILWRVESYGLYGDEPQYLAATMSLWNNHNLELADSMFSPQMTAVLSDPDADRDLHIYEDASTDRMLFSHNFGPARTTAFLPFVAAPGVTSAIEIFNPDRESAGGTITFRDTAGTTIEERPVLVPPGKSLLLQPPAAPGLVGAALVVGKPVGTAVRLTAPGVGTELYFGQAVTPRHCLPFDLPTRGWTAQLIVQNGFPTTGSAAWTRYDPAGTPLAQGTVALPGNGSGTVPIDLAGGYGTVCLAADGPVTPILVAQGSPGLLIVQSAAATPSRIDVPERRVTLGYGGEREVLLHNPGADSVAVTIARPGGSPEEAGIAAHGTWRFVSASGTATITTADGVMSGVVERLGVHSAAVTPEQTAGTALALPTIDTGRAGYAVSQIELTNREPAAVQATLAIQDGSGAPLWSDKIFVGANTTTTKAFWYTGGDSRFMTITARTPLTATLLQREIRSAGFAHGLGLALALLPGYAIAGYGGVLATVALLAALVALALYELLRRLGLDARTALGVGATLALSSPFTPAAVRLYAEVGGTLGLLLALLCADNWWRGRWPLRVAGPLGALCIAGAALFHPRLLPPGLVIGGLTVLLALWRAGRRLRGGGGRRWLALGGGILGGAFLLAGGAALALAFEPRLRPAFLARFFDLHGLGAQEFGVLLDRAAGILPTVPILLLVGSGFVWAIRRAPFLGWTTLAVTIVQYALVALREGGWETWGPPGRYIYPAAPFLVLALGAAWCWGFSRPARWLAGVLGALGLLVTLYAWWLPLGLHYGIGGTAAYWFADVILPPLLGADPFRLFPALPSNLRAPGAAVRPWLAVLVVGALLGVRGVGGQPVAVGGGRARWLVSRVRAGDARIGGATTTVAPEKASGATTVVAPRVQEREGPMFAIWVSVQVKPERHEDFLKAIEEDARGSREDEPGCLRFDVLQDGDDPHHYYFYEVYRDEAALEAHRAAPHYQVWAAAVRDGVLEGPSQATRTTSVFPSDAGWR